MSESPHQGEMPKGPAPVDVPSPKTPAQEEQTKIAEESAEEEA